MSVKNHDELKQGRNKCVFPKLAKKMKLFGSISYKNLSLKSDCFATPY
jgi:hypothetical protein